MSSAWYSCKGCVGSDPAQDTVKVDLKLMLPENPNPPRAGGQDPFLQPQAVTQASPPPLLQQMPRHSASQVFGRANGGGKDPFRCELRYQEELAAESRKDPFRCELRYQEELAAESRATKENEDKMQREQAAAAAAAIAAAAAATAAAAAEEEHQRQEMQKAAHEAEAREQQLVAAKKKVSEWCKSNGYQDMNIQKKTFRGATKFPLHTAAKHNNEDIIAMLLMCGVDKYALDSKKQTAHEVATKLNKKGSNDMILARLR